MRVIVSTLMVLCLVGCVSKKDKSNHSATALVYDKEDAGHLIVSKDERYSSFEGSIDIKTAKDFKGRPVENTTGSTTSASPHPAHEPSPGARDPEGSLIDQKSPQVRHEKMIEGVSPVFTPHGKNGVRR